MLQLLPWWKEQRLHARCLRGAPVLLNFLPFSCQISRCAANQASLLSFFLPRVIPPHCFARISSVERLDPWAASCAP